MNITQYFCKHFTKRTQIIGPKYSHANFAYMLTEICTWSPLSAKVKNFACGVKFTQVSKIVHVPHFA